MRKLTLSIILGFKLLYTLTFVIEFSILQITLEQIVIDYYYDSQQASECEYHEPL